MVTLVNEAQYKRLCTAIGRDDLASDVRFADFAKRADAADALIPHLREVFLTQTSEVWLGRLHAADIIAERILTPGDWLHNVHVQATKAAVCQDTPASDLSTRPVLRDMQACAKINYVPRRLLARTAELSSGMPGLSRTRSNN